MVKKILKNLDLIIASLYLVILIVTGIYSVAMRFIFNSPVMWYEAYAKFVLMAIILIAAPYVARQDGHINMREFLFKFPLTVQKIIFYLMDLCCVAFYALITYSACVMVSKNMNSYMIGFNQPYWQFYIPVIVGFGVMSIVYVFVFIKHIREHIPQPPEVEAYDYNADHTAE